MENLKVENAIISKQSKDTENYKKFLEITKRRNILVREVEAGNRILLSHDSYIDVLWPANNDMVCENELNNNSIVCKLVYKNFSMLFTGDIEEIAEKKILDKYIDNNILSSNILKVAHHGSKTSSTQMLLEKVKPQIALIGVGKDNSFGHPSEDIIERLENMRS